MQSEWGRPENWEHRGQEMVLQLERIRLPVCVCCWGLRGLSGLHDARRMAVGHLLSVHQCKCESLLETSSDTEK